MASQAQVWALNLFLCAVVSASFCLYAVTFKRVGQAQITSGSDALRFAVSVLFDPFFIGALALALGGSVLRIALMRHLGIARTALASEITLVMTLVLTYFFFGAQPRFPQDYVGALLIVVGSYLITTT